MVQFRQDGPPHTHTPLPHFVVCFTFTFYILHLFVYDDECLHFGTFVYVFTCLSMLTFYNFETDHVYHTFVDLQLFDYATLHIWYVDYAVRYGVTTLHTRSRLPEPTVTTTVYGSFTLQVTHTGFTRLDTLRSIRSVRSFTSVILRC